MLPSSDEIRQWVIRGEYRLSDDEGIVFSTILGSCVATCLNDPIRRIGGMNHFHLPGVVGQKTQNEIHRYGAHLMEQLINGLLDLGADRERLEAKLFGGATIVPGLSDIGDSNGNFARRFLKDQGVRVVSARLGGARPVRVEYWPVTGRARQLLLDPPPEGAIAFRNGGDNASDYFLNQDHFPMKV